MVLTLKTNTHIQAIKCDNAMIAHLRAKQSKSKAKSSFYTQRQQNTKSQPEPEGHPESHVGALLRSQQSLDSPP